jgi:hypothetical protein
MNALSFHTQIVTSDVIGAGTFPYVDVIRFSSSSPFEGISLSSFSLALGSLVLSTRMSSMTPYDYNYGEYRA